jgi:hypothetical protein
LWIIERPAEDSPDYDKMGATTGETPPPAATQNPPVEELESYYAFISQIPPPTLSFEPLMDDSTPTQPTTQTAAVTEGTKSQRLYTDVCHSGEVRTVLEQEHEFGSGRFWRRKLVVYSGGAEGFGQLSGSNSRK